jgi:O-antigen/teichoic acid export membrane protein
MALLLIYNTVALVVLAGFPQTVTYFLPGKPRVERAAIARLVVRTMAGLGVLASGVLALIGLGGESVVAAVNPTDQVVSLRPLLLVALLPLGDLPARLLPNLLVVEGRAKAAAGYGVFRSLGLSVCTLVPLALGYGVWEVAAALAVLGAGQALFLLVQMQRLYGGTPRAPSPVSVPQLIRFGVPLGATDIVALLNNRLDRFLILLTFPDFMFAVYAAGAWQIPIVTTLPFLVGTALAPKMVEAFGAGRPRDALALWRQSIDKVALVVVPVTLVFVVAAEEVVHVLFTAQYAQAAGVLRWYAILGVGRVAAFGIVIVAAGKPKFVLQAALLSLATNVVLSVPLLLVVGFEGPAMGTALAFAPMAVVYCWCIARASGLPLREIFPIRRYVRVLCIALVGVAFALAFKLTVDTAPAIALAVQAAIVLGTFAVLGTLTGTIRGEDWRYAWSWIRLKALSR